MMNNEVNKIRENPQNLSHPRFNNEKIAILSYGAGNVASVRNALERLGYNAFISDNPNELLKADKLIFPGVGHATHAMERIRQKELDKVLKSFDRPMLGICLGMQLMGNLSEEGQTQGLAIMNFDVKLFKLTEKVPHMGWNSIQITDNPLFKGIPNETFFYFVHSYYAEICSHTVATCKYEVPFTAAVNKDNYFGVQFHPEKSGEAGMEVLKNFIEL
jgi:imidazole glycerol-phosphate synthase subunit HisH